MSRWLTSLLLMIAFAGGILAGMPLTMGHDEGAMADCCDKAKSGEQSPEAVAARLCCAVNCGDSAPTSSSFAANLSFTVSGATHSASFIPPYSKRRISPPNSFLSSGLPVVLQQGRPRYIQHKSFLI